MNGATISNNHFPTVQLFHHPSFLMPVRRCKQYNGGICSSDDDESITREKTTKLLLNRAPAFFFLLQFYEWAWHECLCLREKPSQVLTELVYTIEHDIFISKKKNPSWRENGNNKAVIHSLITPTKFMGAFLKAWLWTSWIIASAFCGTFWWVFFFFIA